MCRVNRLLLRAAEQIGAHLQQLPHRQREIELPERDWDHCQILLRQIHRAEGRGWTGAAAVLQDRLEQAIAHCAERLQELSRQSSLSKRRTRPLSVSELFRDLAALADEFDGVSIDRRQHVLSVTTGPVQLEEVELGPFEIRLHWDRIGERRPYAVIALEPNPCREADDVTHPHVKGEQLCEGEGQMAIDQALRSGRFLDFFQIVNRILATYNEGSAYTPLSEWTGVRCSDCGDVVPSEDSSVCDRCQDVLCPNCLIACGQCDNRCCHPCLDYCRSCDTQLCASCQQSCDGCRRICCRDCLSESGLCPECQDESNEEPPDPEPLDAQDVPESASPPAENTAVALSSAGAATPAETQASVAVQPHRLGQASLSP